MHFLTDNAKQQLSELEGLAKTTNEWAQNEASKTEKTADILDAFYQIKTIGERAAELAKSINKVRSFVKEVIIPERFEAEDIKTVTLDELGQRFTVSSQLRASIKGDMKEEAYTWLRADGLGDIIKETVNSSTLSATARSYVAENKEFPEELFNLQVFSNTSMTKTK
jgi:hypothetical protein